MSVNQLKRTLWELNFLISSSTQSNFRKSIHLVDFLHSFSLIFLCSNSSMKMKKRINVKGRYKFLLTLGDSYCCEKYFRGGGGGYVTELID